MRHVVMFSGGAGSWAAARRVAACHGTADMTLLFTDTLIEDEDMYRFLDEAAKDIGVPVTRVAEGRTPWQVFRDEGMIGNTRADICSRVLKREVADRWLEDNCRRAETIIYLGIDWSEAHRFDDGEGRGARHRYARAGWRAEAPMCHAPHLTKKQVLAEMERAGLRPSRAYAQGFAHDNCGGGCVKAGLGHFAHLLQQRPDVYAQWETEEEAFRAAAGKDVSILRDRRGGQTKVLTLRMLRERIQGGGTVDRFDIGGCGCFSEDAASLAAPLL